jgi:hypothetical protein
MTTPIIGQKKAEKVLICCPMIGGIADTDPNQWLRSLLSVIADVRKLGWSYAPYFPTRKTWAEAANLMFDIAFENEFTYILRMDDDIWGAGLDYISKLYAADKAVIGCAYPTRYYPYVLAALNKADPKDDVIELWNGQRQGLQETVGTGVQKVDLIGFGLTLIKVEPFKLLPRPLFPEKMDCPDDTYFSKICSEAGIEQYVHMDLRINHRHVNIFNRKYLNNADARMMLQAGQIKADGTYYSKDMIEKFGEDGTLDLGTLK